jgi:hypothetical protein
VNEEPEPKERSRRFPPLTVFAWIAFLLASAALVIPPAGVAVPLALAAAGSACAGLELTSAEETGCFAMVAFFLNFVLLGLLLMLSFAVAVL